jgi:hypothetical protein
MQLHNAPCTNITERMIPIAVCLPDKTIMRNTHEGLLNLPQLPARACKTYLFQKMQSSLVSIGQLCDARCVATFDKHNVFIKKGDEIILQGERDAATGLWTANLESAPVFTATQHIAMSAIAAETVGECIAFLHACAGAPVLSTFRHAVKAGYYTT